MPDDERDRIAAEIGRYFLFHEHSKRGVTRADLRKAVLSEKGGHAGGRMLDYALEHARTKLKETFGMDIQLLKDSHAMDEESKKGPHGAAAENEPVETQAAKSANARLVLVNTLKHPRGMEPEVPKEEELYLALVLVTIGIIRHSDKRVSEKTLFTVLRTIGLNEQTRLARPFPPLEEVISKRMVKDMYLQYSKCARRAARRAPPAAPTPASPPAPRGAQGGRSGQREGPDRGPARAGRAERGRLGRARRGVQGPVRRVAGHAAAGGAAAHAGEWAAWAAVLVIARPVFSDGRREKCARGDPPWVADARAREHAAAGLNDERRLSHSTMMPTPGSSTRRRERGIERGPRVREGRRGFI